MSVLMKTVAAFCVVVIGAALGAHMHEQIKKHDAELRTPGMQHNLNVQRKMENCLRSALDHNKCFIAVGITI